MAFLLNPDHRYRLFQSGSLEIPQLLSKLKPSAFAEEGDLQRPIFSSLTSVACNLWNLKKMASAAKIELSITQDSVESISLLEGNLVGSTFFQGGAKGFFDAVNEEDLLGSFWFVFDTGCEEDVATFGEIAWPTQKGDVVFVDQRKTKTILEKSPFEQRSHFIAKKNNKLQVKFLDQTPVSRKIYFGSLLFKEGTWKKVRDPILSKWIRARSYQHNSPQMI